MLVKYYEEKQTFQEILLPILQSIFMRFSCDVRNKFHALKKFPWHYEKEFYTEQGTLYLGIVVEIISDFLNILINRRSF